MAIGRYSKQTSASWLIVTGLLGLCGCLGYLQYRWIGEVSVAARDRLHASLQASLYRLSADLNAEIGTDCRALMPAHPTSGDRRTLEGEIETRYRTWNATTRHHGRFRRIALAAPKSDEMVLSRLDPATGTFQPTEWPANWVGIREGMQMWLRMLQHPGTPPRPFGRRENPATVFQMPLWEAGEGRSGKPSFLQRPESAAGWLIVELDPDNLTHVVLPEYAHRYLGDEKGLEYHVKVLAGTGSAPVVYQSDPRAADWSVANADASVSLLGDQFDLIRPREPLAARGLGAGSPLERLRNPPPIADDARRPDAEPDQGPRPRWNRWQLYVKHRSGSLDAVVAGARVRNLAVAAGILVLILASIGTLIRLARRAQRLAELQMDFVAGVSHELRTPLTAIHTAAYNLRGRVAADPVQVERYGQLIQQQSGRLKELVEQVLAFARAQAGHVREISEPISLEALIDEVLTVDAGAFHAARCLLEKDIEVGIPLVVGDPVALKQAIRNLLSNALKYGMNGNNWIGIYASVADKDTVEIRVVDRGPGIPASEAEQIFDPFFRGRRAVEDQIHGTGLGLSLAKKVVEAHGGTISVKSEPMKQTEFIIRIPVPSEETQK